MHCAALARKHSPLLRAYLHFAPPTPFPFSYDPRVVSSSASQTSLPFSQAACILKGFGTWGKIAIAFH
jgi:hypothetical protein